MSSRQRAASSDSPLPGEAPSWKPPTSWVRVVTVDAHAEGEPLRVIVGGFPDLPGESILERRRHARDRLDHLRTALMWEPRGHADMYGCILTGAVTAEADFGVVFLHNEGYSTMCGHGIIAVTRVVLELGLFPMREPLTRLGIDTPAGFVESYARVEAGIVTSVYFRNVPSFVVDLDAEVTVEGLGPVRYDLAFGGAYYAYVRAKDAGVRCAADDVQALIERGRAIKRAVQAARSIQHPTEPELGFLYGTIFVGPPERPGAHSRNVCVFADGEVDRSPTGTGVSGRLAIHRARGEIEVGEAIVIESIVGGRFTGRIAEETRFAGRAAVVPEVEGRAYVTGRHEFLLDPADPLRHGFLIR